MPVTYETDINNTLGEAFEREGMNQLRVSDTENMLITFFNGQKDSSQMKNEYLFRRQRMFDL